MVALGIRNEIIVVGLRGMHRRFQRALTRIGDRAGRKSRVLVSVIARVELHVVVMQGASVRSREELGVNDAGVGVERDLLFQTVVIHAGHQRAFVWDSGLLLNDRGHDQRAL